MVNWAQEEWAQKDVVKDMAWSTAKKLEYMTSNTDAFFRFHSVLTSDLPASIHEALNFREHAMTLLRQYELYIQDIAPCPLRPVTDPVQKKAVTAYSSLMRSQALAGTGQAVLMALVFPGAPSVVSPPIVQRSFEFYGEIANEYHSTGLYLLPGNTLEIEALNAASGEELGTWSVRVGPFADDISRRPEWKRFPKCGAEVILSRGRVYSGFGGLIWIKNHIAKKRIRLKLKGAIEAPFLNFRDPKSIARWSTSAKAPGAYAEIAGDNMILTLQSKVVRNLSVDHLRQVRRQIVQRLILFVSNWNWGAFDLKAFITVAIN